MLTWFLPKPNQNCFLQDMDFGKYATACNGELNKYHNYNLFAVCNHFGSMEGGHYTAYCLSPKLQKWFKYDDHEVLTSSFLHVAPQVQFDPHSGAKMKF